MKLIVCDRCGQKISEEENEKTTITMAREGKERSSIMITHFDSLKLSKHGVLKYDYTVDLCPTCKKSFVDWFGKVGFYERE